MEVRRIKKDSREATIATRVHARKGFKSVEIDLRGKFKNFNKLFKFKQEILNKIFFCIKHHWTSMPNLPSLNFIVQHFS